jgi:hypothetical protein
MGLEGFVVIFFFVLFIVLVIRSLLRPETAHSEYSRVTPTTMPVERVDVAEYGNPALAILAWLWAVFRIGLFHLQRRRERPAPAITSQESVYVVQERESMPREREAASEIRQPQEVKQPAHQASEGRVKDVDTRANTKDRMAQLPAHAPDPVDDTRDRLNIPVLFDGTQYLYHRMGSGHKAVLGTTNGGKGNFLRYYALMSLLAGPENMRLVVFDAKGGADYWWIHQIDHAELYFTGPEILDEEKPIDALEEGLKVYVRLMLERGQALQAAHVEKIDLYNEKVRNGSVNGFEWPYIVVIVDEIADFSKEAKSLVSTLTRMGRATGFDILVATQHATVEAMSTQISRNLTNRFAFRLNSSEGTAVALARTSNDYGKYEPSVIDRPGVAVWRGMGGNEQMGLVPFVDPLMDGLLAQLTSKYGKSSQASMASQVLAQASAKTSVVASRKQVLDLHGQGEASDTLDDDASAYLSEVLTIQTTDASQAISQGKSRQAPGKSEGNTKTSRWQGLVNQETLAQARETVQEMGDKVGVVELAQALYGKSTGIYFYAAQELLALLEGEKLT